MAGDPLKKVQSGDKLEIPAAAYNAFVDAARAAKSHHVVGGDALASKRRTTIAKIRNVTGSDLSRFAIVGLEEPIVTPAANEQEFLERPTFHGVVPAPWHRGRFGVLLEPLKHNTIGAAAVDGVVPVRLQVDPAIIYDFADIVPGATGGLQNIPHGSARVLWVEPSASTVRWALVRFDDGDFQAHVLVLSNIPDAAGLYPGIVQRWEAGAWVDQYPCKALDINA